MLPIPTKFTPVAAGAEGHTKLNAFDNALLRAGIGNMNLLRVSSVLPAHCRQTDKLDMVNGSLLPTAYGSIVSDVPGDLIAAGVAIGIQDEDHSGVIFEFSGRCSAQEAESVLRGMVAEAFAVRGLQLNEVIVRVVEHRVEQTGCAFAAVALWY